MPGLSYLFDSQENRIPPKKRLLEALKSSFPLERYSHGILSFTQNHFLGFTKYPEYPLISFDNGDYFICLEGKLYGKDETQTKKELSALARQVDSNPHLKNKNKSEWLSKWLLNTDGEFVIIIISTHSSQTTIISDALGRLPLYYYWNGGKFILSRNYRFIPNHIPSTSMDRMALAQYLIFGYPLGQRTLHHSIFRLLPSAFITIDENKGKIDIKYVHHFNLERKLHQSKDKIKMTKDLTELFCEACVQRTFQSEKNILSLSGGLDSKSVAAGFHKMNIPYYGATYLDHTQTILSEVKAAQHLAQILNMKWKFFQLEAPRGKEVHEILTAKNGLNSLGMSFILPFFSELTAAFGTRVNHFTGDGGDKILPDLRPFHKIKNMRELTDYTIRSDQIFSLEKVSKLLRLEKDRIYEEISEQLERYPEKDFSSKYIHFLIYERAFKWLFEGEDRNRFYFWSSSPFYSIKLFQYAMNCPNNLKKNYKLYRLFLKTLSPQAASLPNSKFNQADFIPKMKQSAQRMIQKAQDKVNPDHTKNEYLDLNLSNDVKSRFFWEQIKNCDMIPKFISTSFLQKHPQMTRREFNHLLTIHSAIELFECPHSSLQNYFDFYFNFP